MAKPNSNQAWIPVSKRLPDKRGKYFVSCHSKDITRRKNNA